MIARLLVLAVLFSGVPLAHSEEIKPGVLRTPDARFAGLGDYPFDPHYVEIDGMRVHYVDEGPRDGETILLIHGEPTWSYLFRTMIPIFVEAGYRVIAPDLVGFGKSDKYVDEAAYSYAQQVSVMRELVVRLDLRDATFFGQDWGGLIGLPVVAALPERFARIVVSNTALPSAGGAVGAVGYPAFKALVWWLRPLTFEEIQADLSFPRWVAYSQSVEDLPVGDVMVALGGVSQGREGYEAPFPERRYKAAATIMPYLVLSQLRENEIVWETLETWTKPFLVAFTDSDPLTAAGEDVFLERVPTAQKVTILGARHFVQEDAGPELARLMIDFMQGRALPATISIDRDSKLGDTETHAPSATLFGASSTMRLAIPGRAPSLGTVKRATGSRLVSRVAP